MKGTTSNVMKRYFFKHPTV